MAPEFSQLETDYILIKSDVTGEASFNVIKQSNLKSNLKIVKHKRTKFQISKYAMAARQIATIDRK